MIRSANEITGNSVLTTLEMRISLHPSLSGVTATIMKSLVTGSPCSKRVHIFDASSDGKKYQASPHYQH